MRLIDADALAAVFSERQRKLWTEHSYAKAREADRAQYLVHEAPAIEAEPVRHGKWVQSRSPGGILLCNCSVCGDSAISQDNDWGDVIDYHETDFCPNCGAKMDGGIPDETVHDKK